MAKPQKTLDPVIHRPVVWVVGASRGIGREIAKQFASIGYEVCLSARSEEELTDAALEIKNLGGRAYPFVCDCADEQKIATTAKKIEKKFGTIDVLVNNAGITSFQNVVNEPVKSIDLILQTNLRGPIIAMKSVLPGMIERNNGWIINILSTVAVKTFKGSAAYTAAKEGLMGFANVLREEVRHNSIRVLNVLPGATATSMWHPKVREKYGHRMMKPAEVAEAVLAAYRMPPGAVPEQLILRPILGDLDS